MTRLLSFALGLMLIAQFNAQITVSVADFASAADTVRISQADGTGLDFTSTGASFNWDYSSLVANSQYLKEFNPIGFASILVFTTYGPLAPNKYKATYFNPTNDLPLDQLSQFLPVALSDLNQYTKRMADSITSLGYSIAVNGQGVPFKSDTIETRYKLPLNYNDSHYSRGYTFIDLNPVIDFKIKQYRQRLTTVDGYGTLTTPKGTFPVLRLRHDISEIDSVYQTFFGPGTWFGTPPIQRTEYEWWGNNELEWLLKVTETNGNITAVEYQEDYLGLDAGIDQLDASLLVFPNPVHDYLSIESDNSISSAAIVDVNGQVVMTVPSDQLLSKKINVSFLSQGYYFLKLTIGDSSRIIKVIKN